MSEKKINQIPTSDRATYKIPEAAKLAGCGIVAIYKGVHEGRIPHLKFGRNILIPKVAFEKWLNSAGSSEPTVSPSPETLPGRLPYIREDFQPKMSALMSESRSLLVKLQQDIDRLDKHFGEQND